ncbi:MAG: cyclic nucleotide-binding domain-containing protein [Nitrospirae bacterium]|nr:MAG: cyclic nucleotide-binding domain-containing protein [Nitrospirota bacterium]
MAKKYWETYFDALRKQDWEKAMQSLNSVLKDEPKNSQVHLKIGDIFQKAGDVSNAIGAYHQSAWLLVNEGFLQKALAIYKIILRLDPENAEAINKSKDLLMELESSRMKPAPAPPSFEPIVEEKPEQLVVSGFEPSFETGFEPGAEQVADSTLQDVGVEPPAGIADFPEVPSIEGTVEPVAGEELSFPAVPGFEMEIGQNVEKEPTADLEGFPEVPSFESTTEAGAGRELDFPVEPGFEAETQRDIETEASEKIDDLFKAPSYEGEAEPSPEKMDDFFAGTAFDEEPLVDGVPSLETQEPAEFEGQTEPAASDVFLNGGEPVSRIPEFLSSLPEAEARELVIRIKSQLFSPGQRIIEEGDSGDSIFLIKSGNASVVTHILGKEIELATLSVGDVFGEVAFLTGRPRTASVIAIDKLELIEFDRVILEEMFEKYPDILKKIQDFYQSHVQDTIQKVKGRIKK